MLLLGKRFSCLVWASFFVLVAGVLLVQNQDAKVLNRNVGGAHTALLGAAAALGAAMLSGFAGVFLERSFNRDATNLWELNVLLALISLPLQALAMYEYDHARIAATSLFHGFHSDTVVLILVSAAGGLLTSVVIKYAGNMRKSFAMAISLVVTSSLSIPLLGYSPTLLFGVGVGLVVSAVFMFAKGSESQVFPRSVGAEERSAAEGTSGAATSELFPLATSELFAKPWPEASAGPPPLPPPPPPRGSRHLHSSRRPRFPPVRRAA
jgi:UDP-sugar transporter A1/2/3